jgi:hypothetical protein
MVVLRLVDALVCEVSDQIVIFHRSQNRAGLLDA